MKFEDSYTEPELRKSVVFIKHKGQHFTGVSWCHPDDNWSEITGCRIAEVRAQIDALKYEHRLAKEKCEECRKFVKAVEQYKCFNPDDPSAKAMYRQLNRRIKAVNDLAIKIGTMEFNLKVNIAAKDRLLKKVHDKKD